MKIEVSNGELVDKLSILIIKMERILSPEKRINVRRELDILYEKMLAIGIKERSHEFRRLLEIN